MRPRLPTTFVTLLLLSPSLLLATSANLANRHDVRMARRQTHGAGPKLDQVNGIIPRQFGSTDRNDDFRELTDAILQERAGAPITIDTSIQPGSETTTAPGSGVTTTAPAGGVTTTDPAMTTTRSGAGAGAGVTGADTTSLSTSSSVTTTPVTTASTSSAITNSQVSTTSTESTTSTTSTSTSSTSTSTSTTEQMTTSSSSSVSQVTSTIRSTITRSAPTLVSASTIHTSSTTSRNSTSDAASGSENTSKGGLSKSALIAIIVVVCVVVGAAAIWTVFRKLKLSPTKRFDSRMKPLDFSPTGGGMADAAYYEKTRRTSADYQREQFVQELDAEQQDFSHNGYPAALQTIPNHEFTAATGGAASSEYTYPPGSGYFDPDSYAGDYPPANGADLSRNQTVIGPNRAGAGAYQPDMATPFYAGHQDDSYYANDSQERLYDGSGHGHGSGMDHGMISPGLMREPSLGRPTRGEGPYAEAARTGAYSPTPRHLTG